MVLTAHEMLALSLLHLEEVGPEMKPFVWNHPSHQRQGLEADVHPRDLVFFLPPSSLHMAKASTTLFFKLQSLVSLEMKSCFHSLAIIKPSAQLTKTKLCLFN